MRYMIIVALLWAGMVQAQRITTIVAASEHIDTIPVWIIYLDSTRVFSAYPEFNIELEVAPGWRVNTGGWKSDWYDQDGRRFNPDNIILDRPRKPVRNPFKE